ncbi:MAG TPA: hypothetical protein VJT13_08070, partial [Xanthobacteraceae bacterium]|nr:hypothetical protein [Xanthobacteraceae bacterium]
MRLLVSAGCLFGIGGHAAAESAHEFWQNESQRQQQARLSSWDQPGRGYGAFQDPRAWSGEQQQPSGSFRVPAAQSLRSGHARPDRRKMPTVRVSNPDFFTYVPDKLTTVALGAVCESKTAANPAVAADISSQ